MKAFRQVRTLATVIFTVIMASAVVGQTGQQDELNTAVREASDNLNSKIPKGNKIVILNVQSGSNDLSDYIISKLIENVINDDFFTAVDRQQLDAIQAEQQFQMSGAVDDKDALAIGKFFGAQTIVSGAVNNIGKLYNLSIRALDVQTAQVQAQFNRNIAASEILSSLLGGGGAIQQQQATPAQPAQQTIPAQQTKTMYKWYEESDGKPRSLKKRISLETGGAFSPYFIYDYSDYSGMGGGGYLRADLIYAEIVGNVISHATHYLNFMGGVLGKYPVGNDVIKVFPLLGYGGMLVGSSAVIGPLIGGRIDVGITEIVYLRSEYLYCFGILDEAEGGAMSFKIGGGLDYGLGERKKIYLRPELMYNYNWIEKPDEYYNRTAQHIDIRVGIGYKWGGKKRVNEQ